MEASDDGAEAGAGVERWWGGRDGLGWGGDDDERAATDSAHRNDAVVVLCARCVSVRDMKLPGHPKIPPKSANTAATICNSIANTSPKICNSSLLPRQKSVIALLLLRPKSVIAANTTAKNL